MAYGVLGIDPGRARMGVTYLVMPEEIIDRYMSNTRVLEGDSKLRPLERLAGQASSIELILSKLVCGIVVIEDYAMTRFIRAAYSMAELGGCIRYFCFKYNHPFLVVNPSKLRSYLGLSTRGVSKDKVLDTINRRWLEEFEPGQYDEAESFALAQIGRDALAILYDSDFVPKKPELFWSGKSKPTGLFDRKDLFFPFHLQVEFMVACERMKRWG